nr:DNA polymerase [bacterium]
MAMRVLHIDVETRSRVDLQKEGASRYARHPSTRVLLFAYGFNKHHIELWDCVADPEMPTDLATYLQDSTIKLAAWHAAFEWNILTYGLGIETPFDRWIDPMVLAHSVSLPGQLEKAGKILGLPESEVKLAGGHELIKLFSVPQEVTADQPYEWFGPDTHPYEWEQFKRYNIRDVYAETRIYEVLKPFNMPQHEWALWYLDRKINETGYPIDGQLVSQAVSHSETIKTDLLGRIQALTGVDNPNSGPQVLQWLQKRGYLFKNMQKQNVAKARESEELDEDTKRVLELWGQKNRSAVDKYKAMERTTNEDGRLRNTLQFAGAGRTWRWAGRVVQGQNLFKPLFDDVHGAVELIRDGDLDWLECLYGDLLSAFASCVRSAIRAPKGYKLVVADLSSIEYVMLAWAAQCSAMLETLKNKKDPYKSFGVHLYNKSYEEITKPERTFSKPPVLGAGYMLGSFGLQTYAKGMGVHMEFQEAVRAKRIYRSVNHEVVEFWWRIDAAFRECIRTLQPVECWPVRFVYQKPTVRMELPSGRRITYIRPRIEPKKIKFINDDGKPDVMETMSITYEGIHQKTRQWCRIDTHPGKITENLIQAVARDVLANGLIEADQMGFEIIGHVHDEIIALVPDNGELGLAELCQAMTAPVGWAPDLYLGADGYVDYIYRKD